MNPYRRVVLIRSACGLLGMGLSQVQPPKREGSMYALRRLTILSVLSAALLCPHLARAAQGNAVADWNSIATSAVLINPGRILDSRALAAVHAAIHDALNAIDRRYQPYLVNVTAAGASVDAAVATAGTTCS